MRNFVRFIVRYHIFLFFLALQVLCFWMIFTHNSFQRAGFINSSNRVVGSLYTWKSQITEYIELQRVNDELSAENEELRNRLPSSFVNVNTHFVMINDSLRELKYRYKAAQVINGSINKQLNYLTLDKGSKESIRPEMGVINTKGLIGVVKDVSEHFSTVIPIINLQFTASAVIKRTGNYGLLRWDGKDYRYAVLNDVPRHADVQLGDSVVTRGSSAIYPRGVPIGVVSELGDEEGSNFHKIRVKLNNNFNKVRYVIVVDNLMKNEQRELETESEEDDQ